MLFAENHVDILSCVNFSPSVRLQTLSGASFEKLWTSLGHESSDAGMLSMMFIISIAFI